MKAPPAEAAQNGDDSRPSLGIGMDASVTPLPEEPHLSLVQTTDFFYPLIDDPYLQVRECVCGFSPEPSVCWCRQVPSILRNLVTLWAFSIGQ